MKNLSELHSSDKIVSAINLFKGELGTATSIQFQNNGKLKEHTTKSLALLICVTGFVTYDDENETEIALEPGDYVMIAPNVKHRLYSSVQSQLILLK